VATTLVATILLLLAAKAQTVHLESHQTQRQFGQSPAVEVNTYTQVDGFDLALPAPLPVLGPPASTTPVVESKRPYPPSRVETLPSRVRPPPADHDA